MIALGRAYHAGIQVCGTEFSYGQFGLSHETPALKQSVKDGLRESFDTLSTEESTANQDARIQFNHWAILNLASLLFVRNARFAVA